MENFQMKEKDHWSPSVILKMPEKEENAIKAEKQPTRRTSSGCTKRSPKKASIFCSRDDDEKHDRNRTDAREALHL